MKQEGVIVTLDGKAVGEAWIDVKNQVYERDPAHVGLFGERLVGTRFDATIKLDTDSYELFIPGAFYTAEMTIYHSPWKREVESWGGRARKLWDGLGWEFRRRVLRKNLTVSTKYTVPNCKLIGTTGGPAHG